MIYEKFVRGNFGKLIKYWKKEWREQYKNYKPNELGYRHNDLSIYLKKGMNEFFGENFNELRNYPNTHNLIGRTYPEALKDVLYRVDDFSWELLSERISEEISRKVSALGEFALTEYDRASIHEIRSIVEFIQQHPNSSELDIARATKLPLNVVKRRANDMLEDYGALEHWPWPNVSTQDNRRINWKYENLQKARYNLQEMRFEYA